MGKKKRKYVNVVIEDQNSQNNPSKSIFVIFCLFFFSFISYWYKTGWHSINTPDLYFRGTVPGQGTNFSDF